jgi:hypothetical protein
VSVTRRPSRTRQGGGLRFSSTRDSGDLAAACLACSSQAGCSPSRPTPAS